MKRSFALVFLAFYVFLCGCQAGSAPFTPASPVNPILTFDSKRAFDNLRAQCAFGPRVPQTQGHEQCLKYIQDQLKPYVDKVSLQPFIWRDPDKHINVPMANIFGVVNPSGSPKIMLCAHWDTRPTAEEDFTIANRDKPIPGADDGASGVAALLELARDFRQIKPKSCIILAFWDGEDWGPGEDNMYVGASYFAQNPGEYKPDEAVLIDMIGQKNLEIPIEATSNEQCGELVRQVWDAARAAGEDKIFVPEIKYRIDDDHIPLIKAGIPCIDLIDFDYASWHTLQDTPDKCDPKSLEAVGRALIEFVLRQKNK